MSDNSHESMERRLCIVCGQSFETGTSLAELRPHHLLESQMPIGWGLCPAHRKLHDAGYMAIVECDLEKSGASKHDDVRIRADQAHRTGAMAHLLREAVAEVFQITPEPHEAVLFVAEGEIARLEKLMQRRH